MTRTTQMADIDQYLEDSKQPEQTALPPVNTSAPTDAVGAPEIEDKTGGRPAEKPAVVPQDEEEERASIREMRAAQTEATRQRQEESEVARATRQVAESIQDSGVTVGLAIKGTASRLGGAIASVPIPGDLLLPLSILLLFFFALIAVNGHTRLMWLWLTLSGNASLTSGTGGGFANTPVSGTVTPLSTPSVTGLPTLPTTLPPLPIGLTPLVPLVTPSNFLGQLFTGVEDIL